MTSEDIVLSSRYPTILTDEGPSRQVKNDPVDGIFGVEDFLIEFDSTSIGKKEFGTIFHVGSDLSASVDASGELIVRANTEAGGIELRTSGADMSDAKPHQVEISYSEGRLVVSIDGERMGMTEMSPLSSTSEGNGFELGGTTNNNFASKIGSLSISATSTQSENKADSDTDVKEGGASQEGNGQVPEGSGSGPETGSEEPVSDTDDEEPAFEIGDEIPASEGGTWEPAPGGEPEVPTPSGEADIPGIDGIRVSTSADLYSALAETKGGETILLEGGDYGAFKLNVRSKFDYAFSSEVTIASADRSNPATFSELNIRNATNLSFDGITFDYSFQENDARFVRPFVISGGENISVRNSVFDGDLAQGVSSVDDGHGWGTGLSVRDTKGVSIVNTEFFEFWRGAVLNDIDDLTVRDNELYSLRTDGLNIAAVQDAVIEGNYIHDFDTAKGSNDHRDMIQLWTNGTDRPSTDIIIRSNTLDIGTGDESQSLFIRNEEVDNGRAGYEMYYRDITIEDNVIVNGHRHGISVGETDGLIIRGNSVLHADGRIPDGADSPVEIPRIDINSASRNVTIEDNLTSGVGAGSGADWTISNNVRVQDQDPNAPGYYGDVFLSSSTQPDDGAHLFVARPGGLADQSGAGASETFAPAEGLRPGFHIVSVEKDASARIFDASHTLLDGTPVGDQVKFEWRFSDGTTVTDRTFAAVFEDGGQNGVELTVTLPDGTEESVTHDFDVTGPEVLRSGPGTGLIVGGNEEIDLDGFRDGGIDIGGPGAAAEIPRDHVVDLIGAEEFSFDFTVNGNSGDTGGGLFRVGTALIASVRKDGDILIRAETEDGDIRFETSGPAVNDGNPHDVELDLFGGVLTVAIDGQLAGQIDMAPIFDKSGHGLYLGNPWGGNFESVLSDFEITVSASDFNTTETGGVPELSSFDPLILA